MKRLFVTLLCLFAIGMGHLSADVTYTVQRGETLAGIAAKFNVTTADLIKANPNADGLFYVGMKLNIPQPSIGAVGAEATDAVSSTPVAAGDVSTADTGQSSALAALVATPAGGYDQASDDNQKDAETKGFFEVYYSAWAFDAVKESGSYGFSWTLLPWRLTDKLYFGFQFSPLNFNFGLVDSSLANDKVYLGPALGVFPTDNIAFSFAADVMCVVTFDSDSKTRCTWGIQLAPAIYIGGKAGVFLGPQLTAGFSKGSETDFGFRAGFFF